MENPTIQLMILTLLKISCSEDHNLIFMFYEIKITEMYHIFYVLFKDR